MIAVGSPGQNELTARLQRLLSRDPVSTDEMLIYHYIENGDRRAALWGTSPEKTQQAVDLFISSGKLDRYLDMVWGEERSQGP